MLRRQALHVVHPRVSLEPASMFFVKSVPAQAQPSQPTSASGHAYKKGDLKWMRERGLIGLT
jgi:hypothetical protein